MLYNIGDIVSVTDPIGQISETTSIIGLNKTTDKYVVLRPANSKLWVDQRDYIVDTKLCNELNIDEKYIGQFCWGLLKPYVRLISKAKIKCRQCL